jgi:hypothetical protein
MDIIEVRKGEAAGSVRRIRRIVPGTIIVVIVHDVRLDRRVLAIFPADRRKGLLRLPIN